MSTTSIILIAFCSALDRVRGMSGFGPPIWQSTLRGAALLAYGAILGRLTGLSGTDWLILAVAGLWAAGERIGWGNAIGPALYGERPDRFALHWWQIGPLKRSTWLSLAVRGFLWGAPCLLVWPWWHKVVALPIAAAIAMPLAVRAVLWFAAPLRRIDSTAGEEWVAESKRSGKLWAAQEIVRGFLIGLFTLLIAGGIR